LGASADRSFIVPFCEVIDPGASSPIFLAAKITVKFKMEEDMWRQFYEKVKESELKKEKTVHDIR
jgi:hypothetical protein